ncbi:MAG: hypothetical protein ACKV2T_37715 [Kofleriaceae bacterium]
MRGVVLAAAAIAGLGACTKKAPEADPEKIRALASRLLQIMPPLAGVRACTEADYEMPAMSLVTAVELSRETMPDRPEFERWINPPEIDAPAFRTVLESKDETARRRAAAQLLGAKGYIVYRVDMVNVPLALEVKELKRGAVGVRAVGFDKADNIICVRHFTVQNDKEKSEWAMKITTLATVDPMVAKALRDDLTFQIKERISELMGGS